MCRSCSNMYCQRVLHLFMKEFGLKITQITEPIEIKKEGVTNRVSALLSLIDYLSCLMMLRFHGWNYQETIYI